MSRSLTLILYICVSGHLLNKSLGIIIMSDMSKPQQYKSEMEKQRQEIFKEDVSETANIKYEQRIVAYLDVLGWSELLKETVENAHRRHQLWHCLKSLRKLVDGKNDLKKYGMEGYYQVSVFSDHIVLSAEESYVFEIVKDIQAVAFSLLQQGFPVRGAIVYGLLYHDERYIFGPALVDAHFVESKVAKYPRIVIAESLIDKIKSQEMAEFGLESELRRYYKLLRTDRDGIRHVDYLCHGTTAEHEEHYLLIPIKNQIESLLSRFRQQSKEYSDSRTLDVRMKLNWLVSYFNEVALEYPTQGIEPIDF
jgi:hypothetical protein